MKALQNEKKIVTDTYVFTVGNKESEVRDVELVFVNKKFDRCNHPFSGTYSRHDWLLLKDIAEKIEELEKRYKNSERYS